MQKLSLRLLTHAACKQLSFVTRTLLAATLCAPLLHANINNIKGTYDILKPEYKHFSVIHGAVAWETGTIRRMYDFGALGKHGDKIKSKTIALVHEIFYRNPDTEDISEFVISNSLYLIDPQEKDPTKKQFFAPEIIVSFVATMIGELEKLKSSTHLEEFLALQKNPALVSEKILAREAALSEEKATKTSPQIQKKRLTKEKTPEELQKINENIAKAQARKKEIEALSSKKEREKQKSSTSAPSSSTIPVQKSSQEKRATSLARPATPEEITQEIATSRKELIAALIKQIPGLDIYPKVYLALIPFIFDAYLECVIDDYMPDFTPHLILLGFLYKQTECNKTLIRQYYEFLNKDFTCLSEMPDWTTWEKETFSRKDKELFLEQLITNPVTNETLNDWYERITFVSLASDFPPIQGYSNTLIKHGGKDALFADCMDNSLRILINFLCYNPETKLFDLDRLKERLGTSPHETVQTFYKNFNDPSSVGDKKIHNAWAQTVISNISFVAYNRTLPGEVASGRGAINGLTKENNFYLQPEPGAFLYEINPSLKNTIIALNHLLGLNLFTGPNGGVTEKEFLDNNFVETYLPKLAEALKSSLPENYTLKNIDSVDYTERELSLPLRFTFESIDGIPYAFNATIRTSQGHGEIDLAFNDKKEELFSSIHYMPASPLSLVLMSDEKAQKPSTYFLQLFAYDLENLPIKRAPKTIPFNQNILNLFIFIALENADKFSAMQDILHLNMIATKNNVRPSKSDQIKMLDAVMEGYVAKPIPLNIAFGLIPEQIAADKTLKFEVINLFRSFSPLEEASLKKILDIFNNLNNYLSSKNFLNLLNTIYSREFIRFHSFLIIYLDLLQILIETKQKTHEINKITKELIPLVFNPAMDIFHERSFNLDTSDFYMPLFERIASILYALGPDDTNSTFIIKTFSVVVSQSYNQELLEKSLSFFNTLQDGSLKKILQEDLIRIKDDLITPRTTKEMIKQLVKFPEETKESKEKAQWEDFWQKQKR